MRRRRVGTFFQRTCGIIITVMGISLFAKTLPIFFWPMLVGLLLIWLGWHVYIGSEL
ncbi:MAG TPA: hypothetical protein GXZ24_02420 [Firmicutes bacterium]|nr:hypothetical protein [Bacillota bacterium]